VVDELDGEAVVGGCLQRAEKVHGLGVEPAILDEPVPTRIARKQRALEIADLLAVGKIIVQVAKTATIDAILGAIDRAARAGAEMAAIEGRLGLAGGRLVEKRTRHARRHARG